MTQPGRLARLFRRSPSLPERFGPARTHVLSTGLACNSPFHVPEAGGAMIFGSLHLRACRERMAGARWRVVASQDGRALGCLWLSDFADSTCGPYQELTLTFLVSDQQKSVPWVNRWTPFAVQQAPDVYICEYTLVLNNPHAVAYGKELHGFDKHMGEISIADRGTHIKYKVSQDTVTAVEGQLAVRDDLGSQGVALAEIGHALGVGKTASMLRRELHPLRVVTPPRVFERRTDIFFRGRPIVQSWRKTDTLHIGESPVGKIIKDLDFQPTAVQVLRGGEGIMPYETPRDDA